MRCFLLGLLLTSGLCISVNQDQLHYTIRKAQENAMHQLNTKSYWDFPTYLGTMFLSEYYFVINALGWTKQSHFNVTYFEKFLRHSQKDDGSWFQVPDANIETGNLDVTVFNYIFLKSIGVSPDESILRKACKWILNHGGIEKTQTMTKFKLAAFGLYPWSKVWYIPLFTLKENYLGGYFYLKDITAQWVYPHVVPLSYLRYHRTYFPGIVQDVNEIWLNPPSYIERDPIMYTNENAHDDVENLIQEMKKLQQPKGSFGAYSVSTLLTMLSFKDFETRYITTNAHKELFKSASQLAFNYVEQLYFNDLVPYHGSLDSGCWWDTILISWALLESGVEPVKLTKTMDALMKYAVQTTGGIAYGEDFEYAPDLDDTGLLLLLFNRMHDRYNSHINTHSSWLKSLQNEDGGFPAFDKGKTGDSWLFRTIFDMIGIAGSAEIFDPSSADLTGHVLEGFGEIGLNLSDVSVQKAVTYLKSSQMNDYTWEGRWGINYIYAAGAVMPGLRAVGYNLNEPWLTNAIAWIVSKQNPDGGFGEATLSYNDPLNFKGLGNSTVSQTAWALLAMLEFKDILNYVDEPITNAINYLLQEFKAEGDRFFDTSVVGTGHRGILYLQYPSYAYSFPMLALARYDNYYKVQSDTCRQSSMCLIE